MGSNLLWEVLSSVYLDAFCSRFAFLHLLHIFHNTDACLRLHLQDGVECKDKCRIAWHIVFIPLSYLIKLLCSVFKTGPDQPFRPVEPGLLRRPFDFGNQSIFWKPLIFSGSTGHFDRGRSRFNWTGPVKFLSYGWLCAWEHMQKLFQRMLLFIVTHSKPFYTLKCCLKLFSHRRGIARKVLTAFLTKDSSNPILLLRQMCDFGTFFPIGILYYNIS